LSPAPRYATPLELAKLIDAFIGDGGTLGRNDWSDFTDYELEDPALERIRWRCENVSYLYPSTEGRWCNAEGIAKLREISKEIKEGA
jgi:hypothetical protein